MKIPNGVGSPIDMRGKSSALFTNIPAREFSESTAQSEYIQARKFGVGFTGTRDMWHYHFQPQLLVPSLRDRCGEADGYIWSISKGLNQVTPIDNYADWCKISVYIEMAFNNRKVKNER